ncbi:MAG: hypothetical protein J6P98_01325, partial [Clostridia bacterium]|nr:hypothetical protein [Clostridia bacterium]
GMSGRELERELEENGIVPEMADAQCVTLITSPCDDPEWYYRLKNALSDLEARTEGNIRYTVKLALSCGETVMSVREAVFAKKEYLPLVDAVGRTAADPVGVYPPGVAVLFPGEIITESAVKLLIDEEDAGAALFGMHGGSVAVVDE